MQLEASHILCVTVTRMIILLLLRHLWEPILKLA